MRVVAHKVDRPPYPTPNPPTFLGQPFSEEIDRTPISTHFRELVVHPFDGTHDPHIHLQDFQAQVYISKGNNGLGCKLFPSTQGGGDGVAMQWLLGLLARTIRTFSDLATLFISQLVANKAKCLEVANLFDIKQRKCENMKGYLVKFNSVTIQVNNLDHKFFGLRAGQFSDSLALRKPLRMEEIKTWAEKHIEVKKDLIDWHEVERQPLTLQVKPSHGPSVRINREGGHRAHAQTSDEPIQFTHPLKGKEGPNTTGSIPHPTFRFSTHYKSTGWGLNERSGASFIRLMDTPQRTGHLVRFIQGKGEKLLVNLENQPRTSWDIQRADRSREVDMENQEKEVDRDNTLTPFIVAPSSPFLEVACWRGKLPLQGKGTSGRSSLFGMILPK
ncbi:hypothetical protein CR513_04401, partial [Mucuna pruriens]